MSTLITTVQHEGEADQVVERLIAAGVEPAQISVIGAQGVPLSLEAEGTPARRASVRGIVAFGIMGGLLGIVCGLLTLHFPGLGTFAAAPGAHAGPLASMATMIAAGIGFGMITGFLANAVAGEENTASYAEKLQPGQLAVVADTDRGEELVQSVLSPSYSSRDVEKISA